MSPGLQAKRNLQERAHMLGVCRRFFHDRNVMEVDCPILSPYASIDAHIDLIPALFNKESTYYLHSSPEHGMKRLLAQGSGDIYQLSHVFRDGECGSLHNPEFMMIEWYRIGFSFEAMIQETYELISEFIPSTPLLTMTYREAFKEYAGIDYVPMSNQNLLQFIENASIPTYAGIEQEDRDCLLNLILGTLVEPQLGKKGIQAITHYPASQASLSKIVEKDGECVSERFEIYFQGTELANGYHELTDYDEQKKRFEEQNEMRQKLKKEVLPIDLPFLEALQTGVPDCCGVAVGFDRLLLLKCGKTSIQEIIPIPWEKR